MIVEEHGKAEDENDPLRIAKTSSITPSEQRKLLTILCASAVFLQSRRKSSTFRVVLPSGKSMIGTWATT